MKAYKQRENLERRIADYKATMNRLSPEQRKGFKQPGSLKKS